MDRGITMLNNGQKVFVPNYGAGILNDVMDNKKYDINKKYVSISFLLNDIELYIPENKLPDYKVRSVLDKEVMEEAFDIIKENPVGIEKKWGKRYRQNNDKIKSGNTFKICEVVRDLYYLKSQGALPLGEKKILYKAEMMLASEVSLVFDIITEEALIKVRQLR
jgi:CarD family transcriptional regulator